MHNLDIFGKTSTLFGLLGLFVKSLKEGETMDLNPSLGKLYNMSSLARHILKPIFESWAKLLGPPLSTSQTLRKN